MEGTSVASENLSEAQETAILAAIEAFRKATRDEINALMEKTRKASPTNRFWYKNFKDGNPRTVHQTETKRQEILRYRANVSTADLIKKYNRTTGKTHSSEIITAGKNDDPAIVLIRTFIEIAEVLDPETERRHAEVRTKIEGTADIGYKHILTAAADRHIPTSLKELAESMERTPEGLTDVLRELNDTILADSSVKIHERNGYVLLGPKNTTDQNQITIVDTPETRSAYNNPLKKPGPRPTEATPEASPEAQILAKIAEAYASMTEGKPAKACLKLFIDAGSTKIPLAQITPLYKRPFSPRYLDLALNKIGLTAYIEENDGEENMVVITTQGNVPPTEPTPPSDESKDKPPEVKTVTTSELFAAIRMTNDPQALLTNARRIYGFWKKTDKITTVNLERLRADIHDNSNSEVQATSKTLCGAIDNLIHAMQSLGDAMVRSRTAELERTLNPNPTLRPARKEGEFFNVEDGKTLLEKNIYGLFNGIFGGKIFPPAILHRRIEEILDKCSEGRVEKLIIGEANILNVLFKRFLALDKDTLGRIPTDIMDIMTKLGRAIHMENVARPRDREKTREGLSKLYNQLTGVIEV